MTKLFDGSGNAVEAFTQEEVDKLVLEHPKLKESQDAVATAQTALEAAKKELDEFKGSDKGQNMAALRQAKEAAEAKVNEMTKGLVEQIGGIKKQLDDAQLDKGFIAIAQGDEELAAKVKAEFDGMVKPDDSDEVRREKMGKAYRLASGYTALPSALNRVLGSSGAPQGGAGAGKQHKPELVDFGRRFGLTEEDFKKYGNKQ